ncbi:hypothetical protein Cgig2_006590 [Carnegiea gigantea]|uniref:Uncharacterized protein n=1 Tax=Carnegiea gigantea TaxID=171969 RepID=A0A9Q1KPD7_9CARY|nr:hypothetical protein Cgig2_006590 [Carnegiea gigantea]
MGANGVYLVSLVKSVPITINRSVLEIVFGLKFTATTPPSLSRKMAKDLCLTHYACPQKLATYKSTALQVPFPEQPTLRALRDSLENLRDDYAELCTQVDLIHTDMGLLGKKLDELIRMTCAIHHGARLAITFTSSDLDRATHATDCIIQSELNLSTNPMLRANVKD